MNNKNLLRDQLRTDFEKCVLSMGFTIENLRPSILPGDYAEGAINFAWKVWQEAHSYYSKTK